jgi:subtilisin-like proprotein convertase family protein
MIVNNYFRPMSPKPFGMLLLTLFTSVPAAVFGQSNPRPGPEINAAEILASSTLDLPDPAEAAEFDKTFSQPFPINDGIRRNYVLATDELYQPTADGVGQIVPIRAARTPSDLARVADVLSSEFRLETRLVMYRAGAPRSEATRRVLSHEVVVKTENREAAIQSACEAGLRLKSVPTYAEKYIIFTADSPTQLLRASGLRNANGVLDYSPLLELSPSWLFLPNDPYFQYQWHLRGRGQNGSKKAADIRVTPVWETRTSFGALNRGQGIVIGVADSGVYHAHPDLSPAYRADLSYNFATDSDDPTPTGTTDGDAHGSNVAGVSAARGYNGVGVTGVAPFAEIAGIRLPNGTGATQPWTDATIGDVFAWKNGSINILNNSWGYMNYTTALSPLQPLSAAGLSSAISSGKIVLFASGNGQQQEENTNFRGLQNSIYVLTVAATDDQALQCSYSTPGSSVLISAPSGYDSKRVQGTTTVDLPGSAGSNPQYPAPASLPNYSDEDYTNVFNGTSSACPVVSGVTALVLQANPSLNWRDVKEIYIRSATRNDSGDSDWARNGAGFWFNHKYGAGLINAAEAVRLAKNWSNLGSMTSVSIPLSSLPANIRDNNAGGLVKYFDTRSISGLRVEHATVTTDISHPSRGELQIQLTSPAGTTSRLAEKHTSYAPDPADYPDWTFSTVHNWGEDSRGLWKLKIADRVPGNTGTLNSATLTLYGTPK